jgi:cytosine/adenosine deaminase-related metal-dependent hydrolase
MTAFRAAWVLPIDRPPIRNGIVEVRGGEVVAIREQGVASGDPDVHDLGSVAVLPGLINAHTHLELSWLRGRVPPANRFTDWVTQLVALRRGPGPGPTAEVTSAVREAITELRAAGTVAVGDITNTLAAVQPMAEAGLRGLVFHELLGFAERDGRLVASTRDQRAAAAEHGLPISLAPHAPYSTSPELFRAIRAEVDASTIRRLSVHLGESPEEVELLARGSGPWRSMLQAIGVWRDDWEVPQCDPVAYLDRHGVLDAGTLVVHGVQFDDAALGRLRELGATVVTCPRSNRWVGVGYPPIERFYRSGVPVAVGTDSLASVEDLNLFSELKTMRWLAPSVPARQLLESATLTGARALGLDHELGSISPGKRAELIAIRLPGPVEEVEEFVLSGISPAQIEPLNP